MPSMMPADGGQVGCRLGVGQVWRRLGSGSQKRGGPVSSSPACTPRARAAAYTEQAQARTCHGEDAAHDRADGGEELVQMSRLLGHHNLPRGKRKQGQVGLGGRQPRAVPGWLPRTAALQGLACRQASAQTAQTALHTWMGDILYVNLAEAWSSACMCWARASPGLAAGRGGAAGPRGWACGRPRRRAQQAMARLQAMRPPTPAQPGVQPRTHVLSPCLPF